MKNIFKVITLALFAFALTGCAGLMEKGKTFASGFYKEAVGEPAVEVDSAFKQATNELFLLAANGSPGAQKVLAICSSGIELVQIKKNQNKHCLDAVFEYPEKLKKATRLWAKHGDYFAKLAQYEHSIKNYAFPNQTDSALAAKEERLAKVNAAISAHEQKIDALFTEKESLQTALK